MVKSADGMWTLTADFAEGVHPYSYELSSRSWFSAGKTARVADPMARQLSPDETATVLRIPAPGAAESYHWKHDHQPQPPRDFLAIYECFVQDFTLQGTFAAATERMRSIADLGFTALELLPLTASDHTKGWGYTPRFFFAVEPRYGLEADLCGLVDEAHGLGMLVLCDGVYSHASQECPLTHIDHDAFFYHEPKDPLHAWGPQFNYSVCLPGTSEYPARRFVKQHISHLIQLFHVDGIRYDAVAQMRDRWFLPEVTDWARAVAGGKPFYSFAECIPLADGLVGPGGSMDACWNETFSHRLRRLLTGAWDGDALEACFDCRRDGFPSGYDAINYLGSHDSGHTVWFLREYGVDDASAITRLHLGFTILVTALGLPMVWMGDEFGATSPPSQVSHRLPWHLLDDPARQRLREWVRHLLMLRRAHAALRGDNILIMHRDDAQRVLMVHRWDDAGGRLLVIVHAGDGDAEVRLRVPLGGAWKNSTRNPLPLTHEGQDLTVRMGPWESVILIYEDGIVSADTSPPVMEAQRV